MKTVVFQGFSCVVDLSRRYNNGRVAIQLMSETDGPIATASVNIVDQDIPEGFVAIKNYSENEGILDVLVEAGVIAAPSCYIKSGYVSVPVCKLLV